MIRTPTRLAAIVASLLVTLSLSPAPAAAPRTEQLEDIELSRPIPGPVVPPDFYRAALDRGTRTEDGRPGPDYWRNHARYTIDARLDPASARLAASETVLYENRSPDELELIFVYLHPNLHAPGAVRLETNEVTGGLSLQRVEAGGVELFEAPTSQQIGYSVQGTILRMRPPEPVPAGGSIELRFDWSFPVPASSSGRMGHSDREVFFIGYWFPKVGVYDDLRGWDLDPYLGGAEFYDAYGDYEVSLTVPSGWTVDATGVLQNPEKVYSEQTRERLAEASESGEVVAIATGEDREADAVTRNDGAGALTYRFTAESVRDFTWTTSNVQHWNATYATVPDRDGDGADDKVMIHSWFRPERAPLWVDQTDYGRHSIEFLSRETGLVYPWPHMSSVEGDGIIGGGMEFPMMTVIGPYRERQPHHLYGVTLHEIAHMWTPMMLGSNEKRYAWMDEGFASYLTARGLPDYWPELEEDPETSEREGYLSTARAGLEGAMMTHGDHYETGYGTASYDKPATLLVTLRNLLGREVFQGAVETYMREWYLKHPAPWDFFSTLERAAGVDLDWFWSSWYYETWVLDHAVGAVEETARGSVVRIEDRGFAPMPAPVRIHLDDGAVLERLIPVSHWLTGATSYDVELDVPVDRIERVEIDPDSLFPDIDRADNVWPPEPVATQDTSSSRGAGARSAPRSNFCSMFEILRIRGPFDLILYEGKWKS